MEKVVELVEFIVKALVSKPAEIKIKCIESETVNTLEIKVAEEDYGRVIGRKGIIINSLRIIVSAFTKSSKKWIINVPTEAH